MKTFEIGKTYNTRSACDNDCIIELKVIARTAKTITVELKNEGVKKLRINKRDTEFFKAESVRPWGSFSMAPFITAEKVA